MNSKFKIDWSSVKEKIAVAETGKTDYKDPRLFVPEFNKTGTSETIIRFLPSKDTEIPYAKVWNHVFKNNGKTYYNNCQTSIKGKCPVCEYNSEHWKTDYTEQQQKDRKRKLSYFGNILIIKDPLHPENNNKVFLFRYGVKIHEKLLEQSNPQAGSIIEPCQIWDWNEGKNFKLLIKKIKAGNDLAAQSNYDSSCFVDTVSSLGDEETLEKIYNQLYSIKDYYAPSNFKSFEETQKRLNEVLGAKKFVRDDDEGVPPVTSDVGEDVIESASDVFNMISDD